MRRILATATAGALVGAAVLATPAQAAKKDGGDLKVMTQNLYLGADLFPAVEAASQGTTEFLLAAAKVYQEAMASDFETRAKQLAKTVKAKKPAIIGLQEVTNWAAGRTNEGPALQSQDFLKIVNKALKDEGLAYKVVGISSNAFLGPFPYIDPASSCGAPVDDNPTNWDCRISMTDRDVILVNTRAKVILSGGISQISDVEKCCALQAPNFDGVIIGKALYDKRFPLSEALRLAA